MPDTTRCRNCEDEYEPFRNEDARHPTVRGLCWKCTLVEIDAERTRRGI